MLSKMTGFPFFFLWLSNGAHFWPIVSSLFFCQFQMHVPGNLQIWSALLKYSTGFSNLTGPSQLVFSVPSLRLSQVMCQLPGCPPPAQRLLGTLATEGNHQRSGFLPSSAESTVITADATSAFSLLSPLSPANIDLFQIIILSPCVKDLC